MMNYTVLSATTPNGQAARMLTRNGTNDACCVYSLMNGDEYRLNGLRLNGWAIDAGSHIGTCAVALALDYPDLRVLAIEPVPENVELLKTNLALNGVRERVEVIQVCVGKELGSTTIHYGYRHYQDDGGCASDEYCKQHRFVAETFEGRGEPASTIEVPVVNLPYLASVWEIGHISLLKIDAEGGEWGFLDSPLVALIERITGEYHNGLPDSPWHKTNARQAMIDLLARTHIVNPFTQATEVGNFEAIRRLTP
jgi:FkbM family methyltransferase